MGSSHAVHIAHRYSREAHVGPGLNLDVGVDGVGSIVRVDIPGLPAEDVGGPAEDQEPEDLPIPLRFADDARQAMGGGGIGEIG